MTMKNNIKFEKELTYQFKTDMKNLANFNPSTEIFIRAIETLKIETLMGSFYPKLKMYELKIYRGVMHHGNDKGCKIEDQLTCQFKIDMRNLTNFDPSTQKSCTLMGYF